MTLPLSPSGDTRPEPRDNRRTYETLFDLMERYQAEHPEATDDDCYEAVCFRRVPEIVSARLDQQKDARREQR